VFILRDTGKNGRDTHVTLVRVDNVTVVVLQSGGMNLRMSQGQGCKMGRPSAVVAQGFMHGILPAY